MAQNRAVTQNRVEKQNNAAGWSFSFVQVGFWMSFCVSVSFAAVYLQAIGYSNGELGLILALGSVLGIAAAIFLVGWIDKDRQITAKRLIPWVLALQTASAGILLLESEQCFVVSAAFVAYIGFCTTVNNLNLKLYADADHAGYRINYCFEDSAKAQTLAFTTTSFGGMLASLIGGQLYDNLSVTMTLWVAFACGAAGAVIMFMGTMKKEV